MNMWIYTHHTATVASAHYSTTSNRHTTLYYCFVCRLLCLGLIGRMSAICVKVKCVCLVSQVTLNNNPCHFTYTHKTYARTTYIPITIYVPPHARNASTISPTNVLTVAVPVLANSTVLQFFFSLFIFASFLSLPHTIFCIIHFSYDTQCRQSHDTSYAKRPPFCTTKQFCKVRSCAINDCTHCHLCIKCTSMHSQLLRVSPLTIGSLYRFECIGAALEWNNDDWNRHLVSEWHRTETIVERNI